MIEFNKPYLYKNKTVFPAVINGTNIICFDSKGTTIIVKNEILLTKIDEKPKLVEPNYITTNKEKVKIEPVVVVDKEQPKEVIIEKKQEIKKTVETMQEEKETKLEESEYDGYDDFYDVKIPSSKNKKRVNIIEKNNYI
jgi:hypothetical protein